MLLLAVALAPFGAVAQEVKSPDGNVVVKFYLDNSKPTYTLTYKGKTVCKPSHLGLTLAKTSMRAMARKSKTCSTASPLPTPKPPLSTKLGHQFGDNTRTCVTTTTKWRLHSTRPR